MDGDIECEEKKDNVAEYPASKGDPSVQQSDKINTNQNKSDVMDPRRNRLKLFNKVMEKSLQRLIADASFHRFAKTFHPFYKKKPELTESIHKQFVSELQTAIEDDITQIMQEGSLQYKLEELDRLEATAREKSDPAWRPSGVPEKDLCSFVMPYYMKQREYLCRELKKLQKENAALAQEVKLGRERIVQSEQRIADSLEDWQVPASTLDAIGSLSPCQAFDHL